MANFRVAYASQALGLDFSSPLINNAQFISCQEGIIGGAASPSLRNVLFANIVTNFLQPSQD